MRTPMDMIMAMMMNTAMVKMMMMMEVTRPAFTHSFLGTILGPPQQTVFSFCNEEKHLVFGFGCLFLFGSKMSSATAIKKSIMQLWVLRYS